MSDFTIAKYLRISAEDGGRKQRGKAESDSISNQRSLIEDYISRMPEFKRADVVEFCEIKTVYLIQKARMEYLKESRNKGFRHIWCFRKPFLFPELIQNGQSVPFRVNSLCRNRHPCIHF